MERHEMDYFSLPFSPCRSIFISIIMEIIESPSPS